MRAFGAEEVFYENLVIYGRMPAHRFRDNLK